MHYHIIKTVRFSSTHTHISVCSFLLSSDLSVFRGEIKTKINNKKLRDENTKQNIIFKENENVNFQISNVHK